MTLAPGPGCRGCIDDQSPNERRQRFGEMLRAVFPERSEDRVRSPAYQPRRMPLNRRTAPRTAPVRTDRDPGGRIAGRALFRKLRESGRTGAVPGACISSIQAELTRRTYSLLKWGSGRQS